MDMDATPGLAGHARLFVEQLSKWPLATLAICGAVVGVNLLYVPAGKPLSALDMIAIAVSVVAAILFLKAALLFALYRFINRRPFDGSFPLIAMMTALILIICIGCASYVIAGHDPEFPVSALPAILLILFAVMTGFLLFLFRLSNRLMIR